MPSLRQVSGQEAIRALERLGFVQMRQRGSHVVLKKITAEGAVGCVVPLHRAGHRNITKSAKAGERLS